MTEQRSTTTYGNQPVAPALACAFNEIVWALQTTGDPLCTAKTTGVLELTGFYIDVQREHERARVSVTVHRPTGVGYKARHDSNSVLPTTLAALTVGYAGDRNGVAGHDKLQVGSIALKTLASGTRVAQIVGVVGRALDRQVVLRDIANEKHTRACAAIDLSQEIARDAALEPYRDYTLNHGTCASDGLELNLRRLTADEVRAVTRALRAARA
jgi:hypothetical protein